MRNFLAILLVSCPAFGDCGVTNFQWAGSTPTQLVATYDRTSQCSVEVSTLADFSVLAADVDPGVFTGSNVDSRTGSLVSGNRVVLVLGKYGMQGAGFVANAGAYSGHRVSRALQADTTYYLRLGGGVRSASDKDAEPAAWGKRGHAAACRSGAAWGV